MQNLNLECTHIIQSWMIVMFNIWLPCIISYKSNMFTYKGILPLSMPNIVASQGMGKGSWLGVAIQAEPNGPAR